MGVTCPPPKRSGRCASSSLVSLACYVERVVRYVSTKIGSGVGWFGLVRVLSVPLSLSSSSLSFAKFGSPSGGRDRESASLYTRAPEATAMMPSGYALFTNNRSHQLKPTFVKACACCACDKFGPRLRALDCWTRAVALGSLASAGEPKSSVPHIRGRTSNRTRKSRPPFGHMRGSHESTTFAVQCRHKA